MKKLFIFLLLVAAGLTGCDKIKNPYPKGAVTNLNTALFPGNWADYPWPDLSNGFSSNRNVVLEDYTGHKCVFCPNAATIAEGIESADSTRVFVISIHTSPGGVGPFQETDAEYTENFANEAAVAYGHEFQTGYGFDANPAGTISRIKFNNLMFQQSGDWNNLVSQTLTANDLKVGLSAKANYYSTTKGLFVHALIDPKNQNPGDLKIVTQFVENSFIGNQKLPGGQHDAAYNFHNTLRGTLDNAPFGQVVSSKAANTEGKFQFDYSYEIPVKYDPLNCHVVVYVMNKNTYEILQAVKIKIEP